MQRACDSCGSEYEAKRASSRFCSPRCRQRNARNPVERDPAPVAQLPAEVPGLFAATVSELARLGQVDTVRGQHALALVTRICGASADTGSSIAAVSKEFRAVMDEIRSEAPAKSDPLDELADRRNAKRAAG